MTMLRTSAEAHETDFTAAGGIAAAGRIDGTTTNLARTSAAGAGILPGRLVQRGARPQQLKFNLINPETGNRIRMLTVDAETEKEVQRRNLVKGYEFKKNTYLLLTDEDFDSVKVDSSEVITVEKFVDATSIDPIYYDSGSIWLPMVPQAATSTRSSARPSAGPVASPSPGS